MEKPQCTKCRIGMELIHDEKSWGGKYTLKFECWNCHLTTEVKPDNVNEDELAKIPYFATIPAVFTMVEFKLVPFCQ